MANDIVPTLFGVTTDSYQQVQQDRADAQALQFAKLDPFQQANYAIGRGAYGLAGAVGGALGGQDPELQRISMRQQIAGQLDYNDDESMKRGIVALSQGGDPQGAMQLQQILLSQQAKRASIGKDEAAGDASLAQAAKNRSDIAEAKRQQAIYARLRPPAGAAAAPAPVAPSITDPVTGTVATPVTPQSAAMGAAILPAGEAASAQTRRTLQQDIKDSEKEREVLLSLDRVSGAKAEADILGERIKDLRAQLRVRFGDAREAVAEELFDKPFLQLTPTERAAVNKRVEEEGGRRAAAGAPKFALPGEKALADIPLFRATVQRTIEPQLKAITATEQALQAINDSLATGNFASYRAAQTQFARAISGAGDLSQRELKAAGADPSLLGGTADYLSSLFTSTPTADTQKKIRNTLEAIRTVAIKQARNEVDQQLKVALRSPGYNVDAVTEALTFAELAPRAAAPTPNAVGNDLAAQAAAEIERRAAGKAK